MAKALAARDAVPLPRDAATSLAAAAVARLFRSPSPSSRLDKDANRLSVAVASGRAAAERSLAALLRALRRDAAAAIDAAAADAAAAGRAALLSPVRVWVDEDVLVAAWDAKEQKVGPVDRQALLKALEQWAVRGATCDRGAAAAPLLSSVLDLLDVLDPATLELPLPLPIVQWIEKEAQLSAGRALVRRASDWCALPPPPPPPPSADVRDCERPAHEILMDLLAEAKAEPFVKELHARGGVRAREAAAALRSDPPRAENPVLDIGIDWGVNGRAELAASANVAAVRRSTAHALLLLEGREDTAWLDGSDALVAWSDLHLVEDTLTIVLAADAAGDQDATARLRLFVHQLAVDIDANLPPRFLARVRKIIERFAGEPETIDAALDALDTVAETGSSDSLHALVAYLAACADSVTSTQKERLADILAAMAASGALLALRSLVPVAETWQARQLLLERLPQELGDGTSLPPLDPDAPVSPFLPLHLCLHPPRCASTAVVSTATRLVARIASHLAALAGSETASHRRQDGDESEADVAASWACLRVLVPCVDDIDLLYAFMTSTTHEGVTELAGKRLQKQLTAAGDEARVLAVLQRTIEQVVDGRLETRERSSALTCAVRATLLAATAIDRVRHAGLVATTVVRMMDIVSSPSSSEFSVVHALNVVRLCFREAPLHGQCAWLDEDALCLALSLLDHSSFSIRRAASLLFLPLVLSIVKQPRLRVEAFVRKFEHATAMVLRALDERRRGLYFPVALLIATCAPDVESWQPSPKLLHLVDSLATVLLADRHAGVRRLAADALAQLDSTLVTGVLRARATTTWNQVHGQLLYRARLPPVAEPELDRWLTGDARIPFPVQTAALDCHPSDALLQAVVRRVEAGCAASAEPSVTATLGYDVFLSTLMRVCMERGLAPVAVALPAVQASRTVRERHIAAIACAAIVNAE